MTNDCVYVLISANEACKFAPKEIISVLREVDRNDNLKSNKADKEETKLSNFHWNQFELQ